MGKNLKGRECGKGICQRKDGKYSACYWMYADIRCETKALQGNFEPYGSGICWLYHHDENYA